MGRSIPIVVREATAADTEALTRLHLDSARYHAALDPALYRVPDEEAYRRLATAQLADPDTLVLVAESAAEVVGVVMLAPIDEPPDYSILRPVAALDLGIVVDKSLRHRGVGRRLMAAAETAARGRGATAIGLDMHAENVPARRLYESLGYRTFGLLMRRELDPG